MDRHNMKRRQIPHVVNRWISYFSHDIIKSAYLWNLNSRNCMKSGLDVVAVVTDEGKVAIPDGGQFGVEQFSVAIAVLTK